MNQNNTTGTSRIAGFFLYQDRKYILKTYTIPQSMGIKSGNRLIVPAGTVYPSNDSNAIGLLYEDVDVTNDSEAGSVVVLGTVDSTKVNVTPEAAEAMKAKRMRFLPDIEKTGPKVYGIKFMPGQGQGIRTHDAVGLVAELNTETQKNRNDFDNVMPWAGMRRCNLKWNKSRRLMELVAYEGEEGYAVDGSNGDVFIEIPRFYMEHKENEDGSREINITMDEEMGYPPAYIFFSRVGSSDSYDLKGKAYVAAYRSGNYNGFVSSVSGVEMNSLTTTTSGTWKSQDSYIEKIESPGIVYTLCCLMAVEFGTRDFKTVFNDNLYVTAKTGLCDNVIGLNGTAEVENGDFTYTPMVYRGREYISSRQSYITYTKAADGILQTYTPDFYIEEQADAAAGSLIVNLESKEFPIFSGGGHYSIIGKLIVSGGDESPYSSYKFENNYSPSLGKGDHPIMGEVSASGFTKSNYYSVEGDYGDVFDDPYTVRYVDQTDRISYSGSVAQKQ